MATPTSHPRSTPPAADDAEREPLRLSTDEDAGPRRWRAAVARFMRPAAALGAILLVGAAVRAWFVLDPRLVYHDDMELFVDWTQRLHELGIAGFYNAVSFCDYPPLSILIFAVVGWVASLFPQGVADGELVAMLFKVPACLADAGITLVLFVEGRRLLGTPAGLAAAALFFLNPVMVYDSAYWGQVDAIYTGFALLALVFVTRRRWQWAGAAVAAALLTKFQTIAFVPLVLFEIYRLGRWRGVGGHVVAAVAAAAVVLTPFAWTGTLDDVLTRAYVHVVGQYNDMAKGAFNVWEMLGWSGAPDTDYPAPVLRAAAGGRLQFSDDASWMLWLNWRRVSLVGYALVVAMILSLYSLRPGTFARYGAAGLLGLAFFLFPTEMHERYAVHAVPFLALWALSGAWRERAYLLFSALLLLNLAAILPARPAGAQIALGILLVFAFMLAMLWRRSPAAEDGYRARSDAMPPPAAEPPDPADLNPPPLVVWFRRLTAGAAIAVAVGVGWVGVSAARAAAVAEQADIQYLSAIHPTSARQGWKSPARDRAVSGGLIHLGDKYYLRGVGTHAPARLVYEVPEGVSRFAALAGIDGFSRDQGSAVVTVELDGTPVYTSSVLRGGEQPVSIDVPLNGARWLVLKVDATSDGQRSDHVDFALARFE